MRFLLVAGLLCQLFPAAQAGEVLLAPKASPLRLAPGLSSLGAVDLPVLPAGVELGADAVSSARNPAPLENGPEARRSVPVSVGTPLERSAAETPAAAMELLEAVGARLEAAAGEQSPSGAPAASPDVALDRTFDNAMVRPSAQDADAPLAAAAAGGSASGLTAPAGGGPGALEPPAPPSGGGSGGRFGPLRAFLPNFLTSLNIASGVASLMLMTQGRIVPAAAAILIGNVFDIADGRVARLLKVASPLGEHLDSLADFVTFGLAPALLMWKATWGTMGLWSFVVPAVYAIGGAYRLARFNVSNEAAAKEKREEKKSDAFTGLPIPGGAGVVVALTLSLGLIPAAFAVPAAVGVTLLAAAAMVSKLPYPAFKRAGIKRLGAMAAGALAAAAPLALLGHWKLIPAGLFGAYLASGPLNKLYQGGSDDFKMEFRRKVFHQYTLVYLGAYFVIGYPAVVWAMGAWVAFAGVVEFFRLKVPAAKPFFDKFFGKIVRAKEADRLSGSFYVSLGMFAVMALFGAWPRLVAAAALYLALGDATSPLVGKRFGFMPFQVAGTARSLDGTAAGFLVALAIGLALGFPLWIALGAALAFSAIDTYPVKPDDNLWIPIVGAASLWALEHVPALISLLSRL